jgi:hypothetical protein
MRCLAPPLLLAALAGPSGGCVIHAAQPVQPAPAGEGEHAWVCHKGTWKRVGRPAAGAHANHGDPVSRSPQPVGAPCR